MLGTCSTPAFEKSIRKLFFFFFFLEMVAFPGQRKGVRERGLSFTSRKGREMACLRMYSCVEGENHLPEEAHFRQALLVGPRISGSPNSPHGRGVPRDAQINLDWLLHAVLKLGKRFSVPNPRKRRESSCLINTSRTRNILCRDSSAKAPRKGT